MSSNPANLTGEDIVDRITACVLEGADVDAWHESNHPFPDFPPPKDAGDVTSLSFAVGVLGTEFDENDRQRRRGNNARAAALAQTDVMVRFLYLMTSDDKKAAYREFLRWEANLTALVLNTDQDPNLEIRARGASARDIIADGVLLGEVDFTVLHFYPLTTE